jgi:DNA invertase Pin-like site-specific DNA recombinase
MWEIIGCLKAKDVALRIVNMGIDTSTPTGKLMLNVIGGVAEFEREMMLERQREGIAKAKAEGKYKGASPLLVPKPMRSRPSPLRSSAWVKSPSVSASAKVLSIGPSTPYEQAVVAGQVETGDPAPPAGVAVRVVAETANATPGAS